MIRSTLFNNVARALRESLNDAEATALAGWLLVSVGAHVRGVNIHQKNQAVLMQYEERLQRSMFNEEDTKRLSAEELIEAGMIPEDYPLTPVNTDTVARGVNSIHDILYHVAQGQEEVGERTMPAPEADAIFAGVVTERGFDPTIAQRMQQQLDDLRRGWPARAERPPTPPPATFTFDIATRAEPATEAVPEDVTNGARLEIRAVVAAAEATLNPPQEPVNTGNRIQNRWAQLRPQLDPPPRRAR